MITYFFSIKPRTQRLDVIMCRHLIFFMQTTYGMIKWPKFIYTSDSHRVLSSISIYYVLLHFHCLPLVINGRINYPLYLF